MPFREAWSRVRGCTVAIVPKFAPQNAEFPDVIGTGFLASREGIVCTCRHVAEAFRHLPAPDGYQGQRAMVLAFLQEPETKHWGFVSVEIEGIGSAIITGEAREYRGPNPPDVAYLLLAVRETPFLEIADASVTEGEMVAFGGFPMGTDLLMAPGWLHQITPTVHSGLVAAVLPFEQHPTPHGFVVHANTQGGASGSPVFRTDGRLVGMVYAVASDVRAAQSDAATLRYTVPTSLTLCVSREVIAQTLPGAEQNAAKSDKRKSWEEYVRELARVRRGRGEGVFEVWPGRTTT